MIYLQENLAFPRALSSCSLDIYLVTAFPSAVKRERCNIFNRVESHGWILYRIMILTMPIFGNRYMFNLIFRIRVLNNVPRFFVMNPLHSCLDSIIFQSLTRFFSGPQHSRLDSRCPDHTCLDSRNPRKSFLYSGILNRLPGVLLHHRIEGRKKCAFLG